MKPIFLNAFIRALLQKTLKSGYFSINFMNANCTLTKTSHNYVPLPVHVSTVNELKFY